MPARSFESRPLVIAWLSLACATAPAALAAQQNDAEKEAEGAAVVARADSARAALVQPAGKKGYSPARLVRLPFQAFGVALTAVVGVGYLGFQALDETGAIALLGKANRDLEALNVKVRPRYIGSRSGPALAARWRGGLAFGDTLTGVELAASHHRMTQLHFWGVGPDSRPEDRSDYAHTRRELGAVARARARSARAQPPGSVRRVAPVRLVRDRPLRARRRRARPGFHLGRRSLSAARRPPAHRVVGLPRARRHRRGLPARLHRPEGLRPVHQPPRDRSAQPRR